MADLAVGGRHEVTPDVSVVIATYNRAHLLTTALGAVADQDARGRLAWEIVAVDNNSSDDTRKVIEAFAAAAPVPVRYVFEAAQGLSHARNAGLAAAKGSIIAFTDDDVRPDRTWLTELRRGLDRHGADAIGGRVLPEWASPPPKWLSQHRFLWTYLAMRVDEESARVHSADESLIYGANMAFRREVFDRVGRFDTALGRIGNKLYSKEEHDLIDRALRAGFSIVYEPALLVRHRVGAERMRKRYFRTWCFDNGEQAALLLGAVRGRTVLGVPLYTLRTTAADLRDWFAALLVRDPKAFVRETDVWRDAGFIWGRLRMRARSAAC